MGQKIDSNSTGLRIAEEQSLKVLPVTPVWYPAEPNSYKDFGGQLSTVARSPINASRQRKKGTITGLDASGGFNQDLTQNNSLRLFQGVMFADAREKATTASIKADPIVITGVTATTITAASGLDAFKVGDLVLCSGFGVAANNGLKKVTAVAAGVLTFAAMSVEAAPPATAKVELAGHEFAAADITVVMVGGLPRLTSAAFDLSTIGFVPGEWVYVGGDAAANQLATGTGFARINAIATTYIEFDKTDWTAVDDAGAGKSLRLFYGFVIKNESNPALIKRRTYQLERELGSDGDGTMSEYLVGACANEMTLDVKQEDKITTDFSFVALDNEQRTGLQGLKAGTRPTLVSGECFNTSSDFSRIKLAKVDAANANPTELFAFCTELQLNIKNNVSPNKAIGTLGAFDTSAGTFEVGGKITAYFSDVTAVQAVRNNADITIDIAVVKLNAGMVFDVPLISLGDGRLSVEKDKAIQLPLEVNAAESKFNHTFLINVFPYLPTIAG
jgi:hypothetical protein